MSHPIPNLDQVLSKRSYMLLQAVGDLERIGDHAVNIAQIVLEREKTEKK